MTYAIVTFGCRVNQADSFAFEEGLRARGALEAPVEAADLVIVNTCSVTGAADQGARRAIRRLSRDNPSAHIVVTGCYATRKPGDLDRLPNVRTVVPNGEKDDLLRRLDEFFRRDKGLLANKGSSTCLPTSPYGGPTGLACYIYSFTAPNQSRIGFPQGAEPIRDWFSRQGESVCGAGLAPGVMGRTAYPLRVQTGCDQACAFCIIPSTRGRSRSRTPAGIRSEVRHVAALGYKEVWLVGVHLGSFGRDLQPATSLVELLRDLDRQPGDITFRISSLEPMDCPSEVIDLVARSERFAPHFHLPLQHASDRVLLAMRRPYTFERYRRLVEQIHTQLPHASIGSDLIAGFPGESDEDAEVMVRAFEDMPLSYLHVFPYSDRPGTDAAAMTPKVDPADIKTRARRLRDVAKRLSARFIASQVGSIRPGLTLDAGTIVLTDNFLKIRIPPGLARNTRVRVRIDSPDLKGTIQSAS